MTAATFRAGSCRAQTEWRRNVNGDRIGAAFALTRLTVAAYIECFIFKGILRFDRCL